MLLGAVTEEEGIRDNWQICFEGLIAERRATRLTINLPSPLTGEGRDGSESIGIVSASHPLPYPPPSRGREIILWIAAEVLPMARAIWPHASMEPAIEAPAEYAARARTAEGARVELLRARLQGLGPVTSAQLAATLALDNADVDIALRALETEGFAMRGQFTPGLNETGWCERRLLARIHRHTIERLRAEIEPVSAADYVRFLLGWHGLTAEPKPEGPQALATAIEILEGFEAQAAAWETDILPARLHDYDPEWLDSLCRAGKATWLRLTAPRAVAGKDRGPSPLRSTPISLLSRRALAAWRGLSTTDNGEASRLSPRAQSVADFLKAHGASFFDEVVSGTGLLKTQAEEALGELVALGLASADSFAGLRALLVPADKRGGYRGGRRRRMAEFGIEEAGRWALSRRTGIPSPAPDAEQVEVIARTLLKRYGVVFKRVLEREAGFLPSWFDLLRVYRRLEARGEIRGGRFVAGPSGEQYALPEVVSQLRAVRKKPETGKLVSVSAADPLNLVGIVLPGSRVPGVPGNRVLYRDGVPIAVQIGGEARFLETLEPALEWEARTALLRQAVAPAVRVYLN
jgi:ATP-dependent Lhr-like helicase